MIDTVIIGAGITGLTAAYELSNAGHSILLLESASRPGGPIRSEKEEGFLVESGPNSLLLPDPWVEQLIDELGLSSELVETSPSAKKRYIVRDGQPTPVPMSPLQAIGTSLFSLKAKLGFLGEPFRSKLPENAAAEESVAAFARRRMGQEFVDYAINPFVSGIYAGDPEELVLNHAFPLMRELETEGGSLIRGAIKRKRRLKAEGKLYKKRSVSFRHGLEALPQALAEEISPSIRFETQVQSIANSDGKWSISYSSGSDTLSTVTRNLIICLPAHAIKQLPWPENLSPALESTPDLIYPCVHSLALGFHLDHVQHPLDGFGVLCPQKEKRSILGALFSSSLFAERAPNDHCLVTVFMGGRKRADLSDATEDTLLSLALEELGSLLGVSGQPAYKKLNSWPKAIPQYTTAFGPWSDALHQLQAKHSGLHFGGHAIDGISLGHCLLSGRRIAQDILSP